MPNKEQYQKNKERYRLQNNAYREANKDLVNERQRAWRKNNPDKRKQYKEAWRQHHPNANWERSIFNKFNLTVIEYGGLLKLQNYVCKLCGKKENKLTKDGVAHRLSVDHCHKCGRIRGLLCGRCNTVLGLVDKDNYMLETILDYIGESRC